MRSLLVKIRYFWNAHVRGREACWVCGRPVELDWYCPDSVFREVTGGRNGTWCTRCFDREALQERPYKPGRICGLRWFCFQDVCLPETDEDFEARRHDFASWLEDYLLAEVERGAKRKERGDE